jgi:photosystem II stability/assembly factor-like uncharacterized protein
MPGDFKRMLTVPDEWNATSLYLGDPRFPLKGDNIVADAASIGGTPALAGIQMLTDRAWVVGESGLLALAEKKNRKWQAWTTVELEEKDRVNFHAVAFKDAKTGLVVGDGGACLCTTNGGKKWTRLDTGTTATLHSALWVSDGAVLVGADGTILRVTPEKPAK